MIKAQKELDYTYFKQVFEGRDVKPLDYQLKDLKTPKEEYNQIEM